jgi:hypothetical protein
LPETAAPHLRHAALLPVLAPLAQAGNPFARQLLRLLDAPGQAWLRTVQFCLGKCTDQGVVVHLFEAVDAYCAATRPHARGHRQMDAVLADAARLQDCVADPAAAAACAAVLAVLPAEDHPLLQALLVLAGIGFLTRRWRPGRAALYTLGAMLLLAGGDLAHVHAHVLAVHADGALRGSVGVREDFIQ